MLLRRSRALAPLLLFLIFAIVRFSALAADAAELPRVVESTVVQAGNRSITYHRLEEAPKAAVAAAASNQRTQPVPVSLDAVALERRQETFFCVATVRDGLTELQGTHEGRDWHAVSTIDFNHLSSTAGIETEDITYTLLLLVLDAPGDSGKTGAGTTVLRFTSSSNSEYRLVAASEAPPARVIDALDAVHAFYDLHRAQLARDYQVRLAEAARRERERRENPPPPPDTVITFWPKRGSAHLRGTE